MVYRIIKSPPGYSADQNFMVGRYIDKSVDSESYQGRVANPEGREFFATIDEARSAIPSNAVSLQVPIRDQFLEAWIVESDE